jgi:sugar (pentulose or hexulose) kinase
VVIPAEKEAACFGCAIIGGVTDGVFASFEEAAEKCVGFTNMFEPANHDKYEKKFQKFCALYEAMLQVARM